MRYCIISPHRGPKPQPLHYALQLFDWPKEYHQRRHFCKILLWSERKLLARIVFYLNFLSNTASLVSSLFVFFAVAIVLSMSSLFNKIIADSAKLFRCFYIKATPTYPFQFWEVFDKNNPDWLPSLHLGHKKQRVLVSHDGREPKKGAAALYYRSTLMLLMMRV